MNVRIGILGCAEVAKYALIAPLRGLSGIKVFAVAGRDRPRAEIYAREQGIAQVYDCYQALIEAPDVDVVYVALPNSLHCEWSIKALQQGKAVLCEKPLAANEAEAKRMADAAAAVGRPLIEAFHFRYHPVAQRIGEVIATGGLGTLRSAQARWLIPEKLVSSGNIRLQYALAGGALMDPGCYCVNLLRYAVGEEPQVIDAQASCVTRDIEVAMQARLKFPGGCEARLESSLCHGGDGPMDMNMWFEAEGDRGRLIVRNPFMPQMGHELTVETAAGKTVEHFTQDSTYLFQARHVLAVMRGELAPLTPAADGVANMALIDAIYRRAGLLIRGGSA